MRIMVGALTTTVDAIRYSRMRGKERERGRGRRANQHA